MAQLTISNATVIAARSRMGHSNKLVSTYYNVGQMSRKEPSCPLILMAAIPCMACPQTDNSFHLTINSEQQG